MGLHTNIEWCDSTINPMMGCDGCELWTPQKRTCYAGIQIERYKGQSPNFPAVFTEPKLYLDRLQQLARWSDLTGKDRPGTDKIMAKPWLNGLPRLVFFCNMGDPFTESLDLYWLAPHLEFLGSLPHIIIVLTKRPRRMAEFSQKHPFPKNFWLLTSVTSAANLARVDEVLEVEGGSVKGISYEPAEGAIDIRGHLMRGVDPGQCVSCGYGHGFTRCPNYGSIAKQRTTRGILSCNNFQRKYFAIGWVIAGAGSGAGAVPSDPAWFRNTRDHCDLSGVPFFFKQWGAFSPLTSTDGEAGSPFPIALPGQPFTGHQMIPSSKQRSGRLLDGKEYLMMPKVAV